MRTLCCMPNVFYELTRIEMALQPVVKSERYRRAGRTRSDLASAGVSAAFAEIYERFYQGIFNYVFYRVSDDPLAEDITAEVFVKALEAIDTYTFREYLSLPGSTELRITW